MVSSTDKLGVSGRLLAARTCFERHLGTPTETDTVIEEVLRELQIAAESESGRAIIVDLMHTELMHRQANGQTLDYERELQRFPFLKTQLEPLLSPLLQQTSFVDSFLPPGNGQSGPQVDQFGHTSREENPELFAQTAVPNQPLHSIGRYQLIDQVGRGGCGEVWLARDPELGRDVAVKLIRSDRLNTRNALDDLLSEGRRVALLKHPGIVPVYDAGCIDGTMYLVSEFCRQGTLKSLTKDGPLSAERAASMVAEIADALHHAHLNGIVHRDIKPQNILLDDAGRPRLTDFGIAATEQELVAEQPGTLGTFAYMSPEQMSGQSHLADPRADIYSLGVVLYELLTGRVPFIGSTYEEYRKQVLTREPRLPRTIQEGIPAQLEQIVLRCMAKLVQDRYTTAADVATALRSLKWQASSSARFGWLQGTLSAGLLGVILLAVCAASLFPLVRQPPTEQVPQPPQPTPLAHSQSPPQGLLAPPVSPAVAPPFEAEIPNRPAELWAAHFGMLPVEILWPGIRGRRELVWSKDQPKLTMMSERPFLTQFGTIPTEGAHRIRIRLERMTTWTGGGLFWDYHELEDQQDTIGTAELLELLPTLSRPEDQSITFQLTRSRIFVEPQKGFLKRTGTRSQSIPTPLNRSVLAELEFQAGRLTRVRLNDQDYPELAIELPSDGLATPPLKQNVVETKCLWGGLTEAGSLTFSLD